MFLSVASQVAATVFESQVGGSSASGPPVRDRTRTNEVSLNLCISFIALISSWWAIVTVVIFCVFNIVY